MAGQPVLSTYGADLAMVTVLGCVFLVIAVLGLKLKDQRK